MSLSGRLLDLTSVSSFLGRPPAQPGTKLPRLLRLSKKQLEAKKAARAATKNELIKTLPASAGQQQSILPSQPFLSRSTRDTADQITAFTRSVVDVTVALQNDTVEVQNKRQVYERSVVPSDHLHLSARLLDQAQITRLVHTTSSEERRGRTKLDHLDSQVENADDSDVLDLQPSPEDVVALPAETQPSSENPRHSDRPRRLKSVVVCVSPSPRFHPYRSRAKNPSTRRGELTAVTSRFRRERN